MLDQVVSISWVGLTSNGILSIRWAKRDGTTTTLVTLDSPPDWAGGRDGLRPVS